MENTVHFQAGEFTFSPAACIFDFDGVVVDTETYHYRSWVSGAQPEGCTLTWEQYLPLKSTGQIPRTILALNGRQPDPEAEKRILEIKNREFPILVESLSEKDILPGIPEFLSWLESRGIPMALASSSPNSCALARRFGLDKHFAVMIDGNTKLPRKPAPDTFLLAAKQLGVPAAGCMVFEDSLAGIGGAVNAGMPVVAVAGIQSPEAAAHISDFSSIQTYFY